MSAILIVDDDPPVAFALAELLGDLGHATHTAPSARDALALLERHEIDLVLSDYAMPEMDGLALLAEIRTRAPELPVVLLTARGSERLAARAIKTGAFDYLPKPFDNDELEAIVARALEVSRLRRDARRAEA